MVVPPFVLFKVSFNQWNIKIPFKIALFSLFCEISILGRGENYDHIWSLKLDRGKFIIEHQN